MRYFYGELLIVGIFTLMMFSLLGYMIYRLIKGESKKRGLFFVLLLAPFLVITSYHFAFLSFMDVPYALRHDFNSGEGTVDKVYFQGDNHLVIDGLDYRYNPWGLNPIEGTTYSFEYLPHSKYIIEAMIVED